MKTKKGEKEKLRVTILEKAVAYFKKHGSGGSDICSIMKQADLTTGALYSHFKSKDDLFGQAVCHELQKLEFELYQIFVDDGKDALKKMIEAPFNLGRFQETGNGCIHTALGTDMQRSSAVYRAKYEEYMLRIYKLFADAIREQFPDKSPETCYEMAMVLYSSLVGSLLMARTMKNPKTAHAILEAEAKFLIERYIAEENR